MKLKKNLSQMVKTDYVPLTTTQEGDLMGGFGSVTLSALGDVTGNNTGYCHNPQCHNEECANPTCANGICANPNCENDGCTINYCPPPTPTPSPKPSTSTSNFLIGF